MADANEDNANPPNGLTFREFCERCCDNCRIVRWLGEENPPKADKYGEYRESDDSDESEDELRPPSPECLLCQQLRHILPSSFEFLMSSVRLKRFDRMTVNNYSYRGDERRPYDVFYFCIEGNEGIRMDHKEGEDHEPNRSKMYDLDFVSIDMPEERQYEVKAESIKPVGVNWMAVRDWIEHCTANHSSCRGPSDRLHVPRFKVLNCETGEVELLLDRTAPYVALSYVWGESHDTRLNYPQTILDSMEAVLALGLRYLWVDRICIDQDDEVHKSTQIGMMDQIYFQAYLTIIACSDDAEQGLPGVSKFGRNIQPPLWLGDRRFDYFCSPSMPVCHSRWASRAWTYQEGILSRRKLFFTSEGVALWCKSMYYDERVLRSLVDTDEVQNDLVPYELLKVAPIITFDNSRDTFDHIVSEYTQRELKFEDDALNACLGILSYFGLKHLWGVGIQEDPPYLDLCWYSTRGSSLERKAFPSWSWTKWKGKMNFPPQNHPMNIAAIETRLPSGEKFDILHDRSYKGNLGAICLGKTLHITGAFLPPRSFVFEQDNDFRNVCYYAILSSTCGADFKLGIHLDVLKDSHPWTVADFDGVEILEVEPLNKMSDKYLSGQFLLVKKHMDSYRRVGVALLSSSGDSTSVCAEFERFEVGPIPMMGSHIRTIDLE